MQEDAELSRVHSDRTPARIAPATQLGQQGQQGQTDHSTLNKAQGVSSQPAGRALQAELEFETGLNDAPVEDASHQQALQHGKGGTEQHKLQRQMGQRFRDLPDALTLLSPATGSPGLSQTAANVTAMTGAPAKLKTDITPGVVTCPALHALCIACGITLGYMW